MGGGIVRARREYTQAFLGAALLVGFSLTFGHDSAQAKDSAAKAVVRIAYFPNLTHAPVLVAVRDHLYEREAPGLRIEPYVVNAGPEAMEALLAGDIDIACVGPSPALNTFVRSGGRALQVVGGVCSGGASLMVRPGEGIRSVADLAGKRVADPDLGGTQDVSLRHFLIKAGLAPREKGGTVEILPLKNPDILTSFKRGQLDAAWVPEPWASRLEVEAGAERAFDERSLWRDGNFTTAVLVARSGFLRDHPDGVEAILRGNRKAIAFLKAHPQKGEAEANVALAKLTGKPLAPAVLNMAWPRLGFAADIDSNSLSAFADAARDAGFLKSGPSDLRKLCRTQALRAYVANRP